MDTVGINIDNNVLINANAHERSKAGVALTILSN